MNKRGRIWLIALIGYILILFFFAIVARGTETRTAYRLDLFWGYHNPDGNTLRDNILNIASFIPIGILVGLLSTNYRPLKALLIGILVSWAIEFSQLIWNRGTFDVDDLFNNAVGAFLGGVIALIAIRIRQNIGQRKHY